MWLHKLLWHCVLWSDPVVSDSKRKEWNVFIYRILKKGSFWENQDEAYEREAVALQRWYSPAITANPTGIGLLAELNIQDTFTFHM